MENTPKSLRLQLAVCGRINAGKSTLMNLISGQDTAITSSERGTTTDVVEKVMELRPLGPAVLLDTAGVDDDSSLGELRLQKTRSAVNRADAVILTVNPGGWDDAEESILLMAKERQIPVLCVVNFHDRMADENFMALLNQKSSNPAIQVCAADRNARSEFLDRFTSALLNILPESRTVPAFLRDLIPPGSLVVMMTPIDTQAPKGRLIMPEVMAIRDALDGNAAAIVAKEDAFPEIYKKLNCTPALAVCDSQVVDKLISTTDKAIPRTTFSILMSRMKGDIEVFAAGTAAVSRLKPGSRVLIAEACTHHAADNDIGKKQIPMLLEKVSGGKLEFSFYSGADFPEDLASYDLVVHCGGCMLNRRAMINRLRFAVQNGVPVTNFGMCISYCKGVIETVLSPFPQALAKYREQLDKS